MLKYDHCHLTIIANEKFNLVGVPVVVGKPPEKFNLCQQSSLSGNLTNSSLAVYAKFDLALAGSGLAPSGPFRKYSPVQRTVRNRASAS